MRTLVVETDQPIAQLLETVASGLRIDARVTQANSLNDAKFELQQHWFDLVLTGWDLPDGTGLDLARFVRKEGYELPIVMICSRSDRQSVVMAATSGINQYISSPFNVHVLHDRLQAVISRGGRSVQPKSVHELLETSIQWVGQLPTKIETLKVLELMDRQASLSPAILAELWREEIGLITRLLDVANSTSFRRSGKPIKHLKDAIGALGVPLALNQALALSLDVSNQMVDMELKQLAKQYLEKSLEVAKAAQLLSMRLKKRSTIYQTSGLLSRVGELAVLKVLNEYRENGGALAKGEAEQYIGEWAAAYGNKIKIQWKLPLELRDMIGAVHVLRNGTVSVDLVLMHTAAMISDNREYTPECQALMRRIGLVESKGAEKSLLI